MPLRRIYAVPALILAAGVFAFAAPRRAAQNEGLEKTKQAADEILDQAREERLKRFQDLERLRKDLRYISEELDRETIGAKKNLQEYSEGGLERLSDLRRKGNIDPKLEPALEALEDLFRDLPSKDYAEEYGRSLVKSVAHELRWIAEEAVDEAQVLSLLNEELDLPVEVPTEGGQVDALKFFPVDVPLDKFKKLGPIKVFLMKHRIKRPKSHAVATAADIIAGKHNVQVGVEVEGTVTWHGGAIDQDYTFNFGDLHIEMTPEWRIMHPKTYKPKTGDKVRIKGWTYFDIFHKAEMEYDPEDPIIGLGRKTQWEVHPVQSVKIIPAP